MKKWLKEDPLMHRAIIVLTVILIILGLFIVRSLVDVIYLEDFCQKQAQKTVGNDWSKPVTVTNDFKRTWPQLVGPGDTMFWGVKEELKCESDHWFI